MKITVCTALLTFSILFSRAFSDFTKDETKIFVSLMRRFKIKECVISTDTKSLNVFSVAKTLTLSNSFYTFYSPSSNLIDLILTHNWNLNEEGWISMDTPYGDDKRYLHPRTTGVVWKTDISTATKGLNQIEYKKILRLFVWIILLTSENVTNEELLDPLWATLDCIFIVVLKSSDDEQYCLFEIYKTHRESKSYVKNFGFWNVKEGLHVDNTNLYRRRLNLDNENLKFFIFSNTLFRDSPMLSSLYEIWCDMGIIMNFSHVVLSNNEITPQEHAVSFVLYNGFLGIFPFDSVTYIRDVVGPLWPFIAHMHVKYESDESTGLQILTRPFSKQAWMILGIWFLVSTPLITIAEFFLVKYNYPEKIRFFSVLESVFASINAFLNHGRDDIFYCDVTNFSIRLLYLQRWTQVVVLLPIFTGAVVSFLTVTIPRFPFNNLNEFVEKGTYRLSAIEKTYAYTYFERQKNDTLLHFVYKNYFVETSKFVINFKDIPDFICSNEKIVFLGFNNDILKQHAVLNNLERDLCRILKVPEPVFEFFAVMVMGQLTFLTKFFNHNLLQFRSSGILQKLRKFVDEVDSQDPMSEELKPIDFKQCLPAFYLIFVGFTLSGIMFLGELVLIKKKIAFEKLRKRRMLVKIWQKKLNRCNCFLD